ncbi:Tctex1 domain-containing protein 2, partial [Entomortierella beljakovae]
MAFSSDDSATMVATTTSQIPQYRHQHNSSSSSESSMSNIAPGRASTSSDRDSISLRPTFKQKFRPQVATKFMQQIIQTHLQGQLYQAEETQKLSKIIAEEIKAKLIELELGRYKYVVNVALGENLGGGARMDARCHWDQESDGFAQAFFTN